ncbi:hypothetical protein CGMCC3_g1201 [Colletotrichum fructicola]|nr:uncharacterized protein CGMCC3_g1201 [Colletotrichum fructicola]KAE9582918.1 hypothetical protein CGMCC3_g1201 [Colletotrichum fructicola]
MALSPANPGSEDTGVSYQTVKPQAELMAEQDVVAQLGTWK